MLENLNVAAPFNDKESKMRDQYRPREISTPHMKYEMCLGLFGTCGSPDSTWRQDFIKMCDASGIKYFNPQKSGDSWTEEDAALEAHHLARDKVIIIPVTTETHGYASIAECGFAMLGAMLRDQELAIYIEEGENMSEEGKRSRRLFKDLSTHLLRDYPICTFADSMAELLMWSKIKTKEKLSSNNKIKLARTIKIDHAPSKSPYKLALFGSNEKVGGAKTRLKSLLKDSKVEFYDSDRADWDVNDEKTLEAERQVKLSADIVVQVISNESESFGSLAESGLLALAAFLRGAKYCLYLEKHPSNKDSNRARTLVRDHINKLNEQFPNIIYLAESVEDLHKYIASQ